MVTKESTRKVPVYKDTKGNVMYLEGRVLVLKDKNGHYASAEKTRAFIKGKRLK